MDTAKGASMPSRKRLSGKNQIPDRLTLYGASECRKVFTMCNRLRKNHHERCFSLRRITFRSVVAAFSLYLFIAPPVTAQEIGGSQGALANPRQEPNPVPVTRNDKSSIMEGGQPSSSVVPENSQAQSGSLPAGTSSGSATSLLENPSAVISHMLEEQRRRIDLPHDLSPVGMFLAADLVVKAVMLGLAAASIATWTMLIAKIIELAGAKSRVNRTLKVIRTSRTLSEALDRNGRRRGPASLMLRVAQEEVDLTGEAVVHAGGGGVKERVASALDRIGAWAGRRSAKGTGILATIGSTAPFVGLFGTVWGIMNAFIGISEAHTTNLAVVAPGIAEALLATAVGLVAAIPAVVIYNVFARSITGYRQLLADAAAGVERLVSRDLDLLKLPSGKGDAAAPSGSLQLIAHGLVGE